MPAIEMFDDFQKSTTGKGYLISKEAFEKDTASIYTWIGLHGQRYANTASFLKGLEDRYNQELLNRELQKARYAYYRQLTIIQRNARKDTIQSLMDSDLFFHADLYNDPHARSYLMAYMRQHLAKERKDGSRAQSYVDYRTAFDQIPAHFNDSLAKFARYLSLEMMASFEESYIEMADRYEQFKETYQDARLNKVLEDRFLLDASQYREVSEDVKLVNYRHEITSLEELIQGYKDQVVYIDLWASWCAPCREGLPHSRVLAREYKDKPLQIIYLSVDKQSDAWRKSSLIEQIDQLKNSYLVLNPDESNYFKQLKIKEIPRYLVYDKTGKLVHQHATGPKGQYIRDLLDKYL